MNVIEAINGRHSIRAFLSKPVEKEKLDAVITASLRAPSWANTQPWEIFVVTGDTLERIKESYRQKYADKAPAAPETPRPIEWPEAEQKRIQQLRPDMEKSCGSSVEQFAALNQNMFNAPAVVYVCMDKALSEWSLYDIGAYSQTFMLVALEQGLSTIPAITLTLYPDVLRRELKIPDNLKITICIAVGFADVENGINNFVSARKPLGETVRFFE
ncbi:MAG: nitroreductase [Synergistaceae bacterium]|jgi:nitroreductase|nr:nitroreductase [Synergistaceae bacterium]